MQDARNLVDAMPAGARERVELLEGDTSSIDLGLSGRELARLADEVEVIHHAAQVTYQKGRLFQVGRSSSPTPAPAFR
jgi:hypothetical protein